MFLEELEGLCAAGGDGGERGEEAEGEEVVGGAGEVGGGREGGGYAGWEGECGEDVDAVGEGEEGDGEVDGRWVDWLTGRAALVRDVTRRPDCTYDIVAVLLVGMLSCVHLL